MAMPVVYVWGKLLKQRSLLPVMSKAVVSNITLGLAFGKSFFTLPRVPTRAEIS